MKCRRGFTLVELLVVVGILAATGGVVIPVIGKLAESSARIRCSANLHQIGVALLSYRIENYGRLPHRPSGLDQTNPHVLRYKQLPDSVAGQLTAQSGSRDIFYCPGNPQDRNAATWWPYSSGTIAITYQFPFWLKKTLWLVPMPNYDRPSGNMVIAADYLGADSDPNSPLAWNHRLSPEGSPQGMNMLFGDGHVEWRGNTGGWVNWGRSNGPFNWYLAK